MTGRRHSLLARLRLASLPNPPPLSFSNVHALPKCLYPPPPPPTLSTLAHNTHPTTPQTLHSPPIMPKRPRPLPFVLLLPFLHPTSAWSSLPPSQPLLPPPSSSSSPPPPPPPAYVDLLHDPCFVTSNDIRDFNLYGFKRWRNGSTLGAWTGRERGREGVREERKGGCCTARRPLFFVLLSAVTMCA